MTNLINKFNRILFYIIINKNMYSLITILYKIYNVILYKL